MLDDMEREIVSDAMRILCPADFECWCPDDAECTLEHPMCSDRHAQVARKKLDSLMSPEVTTLHPERLTNPAERIFFEQAKKFAERQGGVNSGFTTLEHVLNPDLKECPPRVSQRDAAVIGTFVQWLGTNCGYSFLWECNRRIEDERAERRLWRADFCDGQFWTSIPEPDDWCDRQAAMLVDTVLTEGHKQTVMVRRVSRALRQMLALFAYEAGKISGEQASKYVGENNEQFKKMHKRALEAAERLAKPQEAAATA